MDPAGVGRGDTVEARPGPALERAARVPRATAGRSHRGVADGGEDVELGQSAQGVDALQRAAKGLVEYVADARPPAAVGRDGSGRSGFNEIECSQAAEVNICSLRIYMN